MVVALISAKFEFVREIEWREDVLRVLWLLATLTEVEQPVVSITDVKGVHIREEWIWPDYPRRY